MLRPAGTQLHWRYSIRGFYGTASFDTIAVTSAGGRDINVAKLSTMDVTTAVRKIEKGAEISMYPNPARDFIHISAEGMSATITVLDVTGRAMMVEQAQGKQVSLDVSDLAPGIYFVDIVSADKRVSKKLVIE